MSIKIMAKVWELDLKSTDKLVLLALADHANDDGECYPSLTKVRTKSGLSKQGLLNSIDRLIGYGFLTKEHRVRNDNSQTSNLYHINVDLVVNEVDGGGQRSGLGGSMRLTGGVNVVDSFNHQVNHQDKPSFNKIDTKRFTPPTLEEVQSYIKEKSLNVNAKDFFDYYDVSGWVDAKGQKVKNWKQKLLTWNNRGFNNNGKPKQKETQRELIDRVVSGMGYKIEDKQDDVIDVEFGVGDIF